MIYRPYSGKKQLNKIVSYAKATLSTAVDTTEVIPVDDTIPQNDEGEELITCTLNIKEAGNSLYIVFDGNYQKPSGSNSCIFSFFKNSDTDAFDVIYENTGGSAASKKINIDHLIENMTAGEVTVKVRYGSAAGSTTRVNSDTGSTTRLFGGIRETVLRLYEIEG